MKLTIEFNLEHAEGPQLPTSDRTRLLAEVIEEQVGSEIWVDDTKYNVVDSLATEPL